MTSASKLGELLGTSQPVILLPGAVDRFMFLGPFQEGGDFRDAGINGPRRFLDRVWVLVGSAAIQTELPRDLVARWHRTKRKVTEDLEALHYNTAIAALMLASYSNFGNSGVDLFAPGGDLLPGGSVFDLVIGPCSHFSLTLPFDCSKTSFLLVSGTSASAPHVAAAAAVVEAEFPGAGPKRIEACIRQNTDIIGPARVFGAGRLNVLEAAACNDTP